MKFAVFLPAQCADSKRPVLYYLAGLTCTEAHFSQKASIGLKRAAELGIVMVFPDTSQREVEIEGDRASYDFGIAAGFYLDAIAEKWKKNYNMYTHITEELRSIVNEKFNVLPDKQGIMGHSMGGHGALTIYAKNTDKFVSCSAFAPICNPINCAWGQKAFGGYLGEDQEQWKKYDACELAASSSAKLAFYIDQGEKDQFYPGQLLPENLEKVCKEKGHEIVLNLREGYDHSYYTISTFVEDHINYHWERIKV